ncbi:GIY-YIG nuclease family protein [Microvirga mediterraneensis]|uniref:GIY-YIG nuclease family protein n=1 Tax=Microvirga mediterraneensis TaxID=2754695 RepID=A0A838BT21_9HYPH|nr:GIY-YIG nuclease family protein [Microvirga mediterraneensis]MBA1158581.1 GIY-YIG nuclease family protein [Microvirga mediterraneensis]
MQGIERKAAIAAYKEAKVVAGIYAVRCRPTGMCWLGRSPNLSKIQNRVWFTLRQGSHTCRSLQAEWRAHGPDAFILEEIERLEDESSAYLQDRLLKERLAHWTEKLGAEAL